VPRYSIKCVSCINGVAGYVFPHRCTICDGNGNIFPESKLEEFMCGFIGESRGLEDLGKKFNYQRSSINTNGQSVFSFKEVAKALDCSTDSLLNELTRQFDQGVLDTNGFRFWEQV